MNGMERKRLKDELKKQFWACVLLAVLLGIACGCLHAYSVAHHKAQGDTFTEQLKNRERETVQREYGQITESESHSEAEVKEVVVLIDDGIPNEIKEAAEKYGEEYCICPELIESLAYQESRFIADVVSADGVCVGACQINLKCHKARMKRLGVTDLTDAEQNIHVACDYLAELLTEHEDIAEALYIFNGNTSGLEYYQRTGDVKSKYVNEILERSMEYEQLHGKR